MFWNLECKYYSIRDMQRESIYVLKLKIQKISEPRLLYRTLYMFWNLECKKKFKNFSELRSIYFLKNIWNFYWIILSCFYQPQDCKISWLFIVYIDILFTLMYNYIRLILIFDTLWGVLYCNLALNLVWHLSYYIFSWVL